MNKPIFKSKIKPIILSPEAIGALKALKDSPMWDALKQYMIEYTRFHRDRAFFLDETQDDFTIKHCRYTSRCDGMTDLKNFIEKGIRKKDPDA